MSASVDPLIQKVLDSLPVQSQLLKYLLENFSGTVTLGPAGQGTKINGNEIQIDASWLPHSGSKDALTAAQLAEAIGHELAHGVLPYGNATYLGSNYVADASTPAASMVIGERSESEAYAAEYVIAAQLKDKSSYFTLTPEQQPILAMLKSDVGTTDLSKLTDTNSLTNSQYYISATGTSAPGTGAVLTVGNAGPLVDGLHTSINHQLSYKYFWQDQWVMTRLYGFSAKDPSRPNAQQVYDLTQVKDTTIKVSGKPTTGWTFSVQNLPVTLQAVSLPSGGTLTAAKATLSFSGSESSAGALSQGVYVYSVPASGQASAQNWLFGGSGNDVLQGRSGANWYEVQFSNSTNNTVTVLPQSWLSSLFGGSGSSGVFVNGINVGGSSSHQLQQEPQAGAYHWSVDGNSGGYQYTLSGQTLTISNADLWGANKVVIPKFNLSAAESNTGYLGIFLAPSANLTAKATVGTDPPAIFSGGSEQSYTFSIDAPLGAAETVTLTLSGASPSDFVAVVGNTTSQLSPNGSFTLTLGADQTNVSFGLLDVTADTGSSDIAGGATLQLVATTPNSDNSVAQPIVSAPLVISYLPELPDASTTPQAGSVITGTTSGGVTTYQGDGGDDSIVASAGPNKILASNSGSDSIVGGSGSNTIYGGSGNDIISLSGNQDWVSLGNGFNTLNGSSGGGDTINGAAGDAIISGNGGKDLVFAGNGNNELYANSQTSLSNAISQSRSATASHQQGDLLAVLDGNNTVVGGNGNDLITAGAGHDVIVLGPGNDDFFGGVELTTGQSNWSVTVTQKGLNFAAQVLNAPYYEENYTNPYLQPYDGSFDPITGNPSGVANDTIFAGNGNDYIALGNGGNYVELGTGTDTVLGGLGTDTIVAGSGADVILGGGGSTYIYGGSGADSIYGGDGNNTVIGGSGNSTIFSASDNDQGLGFGYANANLEQNYVTGGSGNDVIYGSAGSDTLIGGTGNVTIYGGPGNENITGGAGNDELIAGVGNTTISAGGAGTDTLQGGTGSSSTYIIYGGSGTDAIAAQDGTNVLYAGDGGTASAPTSVFASQTDSASQTTIYGGLGVDSLTGGSGNTVMYAGDGGTSAAPTSVYAFSGNTTIYGGLGTDVLQGGSGTDVIYAGDGGTTNAPTTVLSGTGTSTLYGGAGAALLQDSNSGQDLIVAGTSDDTLIGIGNDTLVAGSGTDVLQSNGGAVTIELNAGFGNDTIQTSNGSPESVTFGTGLAPTDYAGQIALDQSGNAGLLLSGDGGSIFVQNGLTGGLSSASFADSGSTSLQTLLMDAFGGDQSSISGSTAVLLNLANNKALTGGLEPNDTISSFGNSVTISGGTNSFDGNMIYAAGSSDTISTNSAARDTVNATGNNDTVSSNFSDAITVSGSNSLATAIAASDTLTASGANDTLIGQGSADTFYVNNATDVVQAPSGGGTDTIFASVSYSAPTNVNVLHLNGSANISATGNSGADSLFGGGGNDTLVAGSGIDTLIGGTGTTTFVVNNTADVILAGYSAAPSIQSSVSFTLPLLVNVLTLTGAANLIGTANSGNDTLTSNTGVDTLVGGAGNDTFIVNNAADIVQDTVSTRTNTIQSAVSYTAPTNVNVLALTGTANLSGTGNTGDDTLVSNSGIDTLVGGSGNDTFVINNASDVVQDGSATNNTIQAWVNYTLPTNVNALQLMGSASLVATGNSAADVITANSGVDTLVAGAGIATLVGGSGNDTFVVNNTADVVQDSSTTSNNAIQASVSYTAPIDVNTLYLTGTANLQGAANGGNDTLVSNTGVDTLIGGSGADTFVINNSADVIRGISASVSNVAQASVNYTLPTNVNTLILTGTANLTATANSGNDSLVGNAGNDSLLAMSGTDTLVAGSGVDTLIGGAGNDLFIVNNIADVVSVGGVHGTDTIQSSVSFTLPTGVTQLQLTGSANLAGSAVSGNNSIIGNSGSDTLSAGTGNDTLIAGPGPTTLLGGSGADTFEVSTTSVVIANVSANPGNSVVASVSFTLPTNIDSLTLFGNASLVGSGNGDAQNTLTAGSGADTLISGTGLTTLIGGVGYDTFEVNNSSDVVQALAAAAGNIVVSSVSYTVPTNVTTLILSGTTNLAATGNTSADSLVGGSGNDTLTAGVGNDTLVAGTGLATLIGGIGNDTFVVNNVGDVVQDSQATEHNTLISSVSITLPTNVNGLILNGSANLTGTANSGSDSLVGNAGNDLLIAGSGIDTLVAGAGLTTLQGGTGSDTFVVNNSADVIQNASGTGANVLLTSATYTAPVNVNTLTLTGPGNISGTGNSANDSLTVAGNGNDTLISGSGIDTLTGGSGNETFIVNNTADVVIDTAVAANNTLQSSVSYVLPTNVNTLVLTGSANVTGTANSGNDTLISNSGVDNLVGGAGNDLFVVNNTADIVQDTSSTTANAVQSSVSFVLPVNVNVLTLTGTGNLQGTANNGNDTLVSNASVDTLIGGSGNDTFVVSNSADVVQDTSATGSNTLQSSVSYTLPTNINTLILTGSAALTATGNAGSDVLTANSGADTLVAGAGAATLIGGSGNDTFVVNSASDVIQDSSAVSNNTIVSSVSYTLPANVQSLQLTGSANLSGSANAVNDTLVSNSGVDTLVGAAAGQNVFVVNNPADVIQNWMPTDTIQSAVSYTLPGGGSLILIGSANVQATGSGSADTLIAGSGNDTLTAGTGPATLIGGAGNDTFVVNSASDLVEDTVANTSNVVEASVSYSLPSNVDSLIIGGSGVMTGTGNNDASNVLTATTGAVELQGESYATTLYGGSGADTLLAGSGDNVIYAGSGADLVYGGSGLDLIYGGSGTSTIYGGAGYDSLYGTAGAQLFDQASGQDLLVAGGGAETLIGSGADTVVAGTGADRLFDSPLGTYVINAGFGQATIGSGAADVDNLLFGTGLSPSSFSVSLAQTNTTGNAYNDLSLILSSGASRLAISGGMSPATIGTLIFTDTGAENLAQMVNQDGSGTSTVSADGKQFIFSSNNGQTISAATGTGGIYAYGASDSITSTLNSAVPIDAYGSANALIGSNIWAGGDNDSISLLAGGAATLAGNNDTLFAGNGDTITLNNASSVVTLAPGAHVTLDSNVSYTLPSGVQNLYLAAGLDGLIATSNAQGGNLLASGDLDTLIGGAGADTLRAVGNGDVVVAGSGTEQLTAAGNNDTLIGGSGADAFVLSGPSDSIQFGTGSASLNSVDVGFSYTLSGGANTLTQEGSSATAVANNANDTIRAVGLQDTLVGGSGNDTFIIQDSTDVIVDTSTTASNVLQTGGNYTLPTNVNTLILTQGDIIGTANSANDSLVANNFADTLVGGSGSDTLVASTSASGGNSVLVAGTGTDVLQDASSFGNTFEFNSGFSQDQILVGTGDIIQFGAGITQSNLTFTALAGAAGSSPSFAISGAGGHITVQGGLAPGAISSIQFGDGSTATLQQLLAPSGDVTVAGPNGNLILSPTNSHSITGGTGDDTIIAWGNTDTLNAGTGGALIYAEGTGDIVSGGAGTDTLVGDGANSTLVGGAGNESLVVNNGSTTVQVSAGVGHDTVYSSVNYTVPSNVTVLDLTGAAPLVATGNSANDLIAANSGRDTLVSGSGIDTLVGGAGNDVFIVNSASDVVQVSGTSTRDTIQSSASYTLPINVNTLILTGSANVTATGNSGNDFIRSNLGNDVIQAGSGNDTLQAYYDGVNVVGNVTLIAGSGNDSLFAGFAAGDSLVSGSGVDTLAAGQSNVLVINNSADVLQLAYGGGAAYDTIQSSVSYEFAPGVANDQSGVNAIIIWSLTGSGNIYANAGINNGNFTIQGNAGSDTLTGGIGSNDLIGGTGIDTLIGGGVGSSNVFTVTNSADVVIAQTTATYNELDADASYTLPTAITNLYVKSAGLVGTGNSANDYLEADGGNDTLVAGGGTDTLLSAFGTNTLVGGSGNDLLTLRAGDTALFNTGFGASTVTISGGTGTPTVRFGAGVTPGSLTASTTLDSGNRAALVISDGASAVTLGGALAGQTYQFNFNGAGTLTLAQFLAQVTVNTSSVAGASGNVILEGTANTSVAGGSGNDTIYAAATGDTIVGGSGNQVLDALGTADSVVGGSAADTLVGLGTSDTLTGGAVADTFIGGTGATVVFAVNNTSDAIQLQSSPGADTVAASVNFTLPANVNTLILTGTAALKGSANAGADTLISNSGLDTLTGAAGNDFFVVNNVADVIQDTSTTASNTIQAAFSYTLPTNVNTLLLTGTVALTGTANSATDTLISNSGADTLFGSTGNDTFVLNNAADIVQDTSTTARNTIQAGFSYTLPTNVNGLILLGSGNLTGTANNGSDTLTANAGIDTLIGGAGNDIFIVSNTADVVQDTSSTASNAIQSSVSYVLPANVNSLTLTGTANLAGTANGGNDTLSSNTGIDTFIGGAGNDTFVISNGADVITDTSTTASNTLQSSVSYTLPTNVNALTLTGTAALAGTANSGNDTLTSNTGTDILVGGAGNDTFVISNAADVVTDTSTTANNILRSSVSFTLPTNVNALVLTGTAALKGTANGANDTLTSNSGLDTLVGGNGNETFVVSNSADVITDTSSTANNVLQSSVNFTLPTNVNTLIFTGTAALVGTANSSNDVLTANTGSDTLVAAGSGADTLISGITGTDSLVGGSGNDTFIVNNTADKTTDTSTTTHNTLQASVNYTLPTNVTALVLTGTSALLGTGNAQNDSLTANSGNDTLTAGAGVATMFGGAGNDTFVINNTADVIQDSFTTSNNTLSSTVNYTLPTNVNSLLFTGTAALIGNANAGNDLLTANTGADTLIAGAGTDTLVAGTAGIDSLVGGTGTDVFEVNFASDVVSVAAGNNDTVQSSVSYTLPTNVQYLTMTGTAALTGTGNSLTDLLVGNTGADTLVGGTGIAVLEGGRTAGQDLLKATGNQAALIGGAKASTLTGGAFKDFLAAGLVSDSITTGATANVIAVNKGDGLTTLAPTASAANVLSLGAGIDTESLFFTKTGNNLVLTDGVTGDSVTFTNWYASASNQVVTNLQVVEIASASYNASGTDALRNKALEDFNFTSLVSQFNTAGSPSNWALSNGMPTAQLTSSATQAYGGDLAYYFGLNGNLTGMNLSAAQSTLTNTSYATAAQTIDSWSAISGGTGLHLLIAPPSTSTSLVDESNSMAVPPTETETVQPIVAGPATDTLQPDVTPPAASVPTQRLRPHLGIQLRDGSSLDTASMRFVTPAALGTDMSTAAAIPEASATVPSEVLPRHVMPIKLPTRPPVSFVDPIALGWSRLHASMSWESRGIANLHDGLASEHSAADSTAFVGGASNLSGHRVTELSRATLVERVQTRAIS